MWKWCWKHTIQAFVDDLPSMCKTLPRFTSFCLSPLVFCVVLLKRQIVGFLLCVSLFVLIARVQYTCSDSSVATHRVSLVLRLLPGCFETHSSKTKTKKKQKKLRSVSHQAPNIWNKLHETIGHSPSVFPSLVCKAHLFRQSMEVLLCVCVLAENSAACTVCVSCF